MFTYITVGSPIDAHIGGMSDLSLLLTVKSPAIEQQLLMVVEAPLVICVRGK